jgi:phosphoglycolate phosphatase-like HAD superfamily hydrolase
MFIRDGVLINRMHVNPVAFAFAYLSFVDAERQAEISLAALINFGFEKSGLAASEKMRLFNEQHSPALEQIDAAATFYNTLATAAASHCTYFEGAVQLLEDLHAAGARNFITSAVEQDVLDAWAHTAQGTMIAPRLVEILGKRENFHKGREHFEYAASQCDHGRIYYVADAVSEIQVGRQYADQFKITPIGFAYAVSLEQVLDAVRLVQDSLATLSDQTANLPLDVRVDPALLHLPNAAEIEQALKTAGASTLAIGTAGDIMANLQKRFEEVQLLTTSSL